MRRTRTPWSAIAALVIFPLLPLSWVGNLWTEVVSVVTGASEPAPPAHPEVAPEPLDALTPSSVDQGDDRPGLDPDG